MDWAQSTTLATHCSVTSHWVGFKSVLVTDGGPDERSATFRVQSRHQIQTDGGSKNSLVDEQKTPDLHLMPKLVNLIEPDKFEAPSQ